MISWLLRPRLHPCVNCGRPTRRVTAYGRWCWPCAVDFNAAVARDAKGFPVFDANGLPVMLAWPPKEIEEEAAEMVADGGQAVTEAVESLKKADPNFTKGRLSQAIQEALSSLSAKYPGGAVARVVPEEPLDVYACHICGKAAVHLPICRRCMAKEDMDREKDSASRQGNPPPSEWRLDNLPEFILRAGNKLLMLDPLSHRSPEELKGYLALLSQLPPVTDGESPYRSAWRGKIK